MNWTSLESSMGFHSYGYEENSRLMGKLREDSMSMLGAKFGLQAC